MKYGKLSGTLRNAVKLYLDRKESDRVLAKLEKLQRENPVTCTPSEILRSIKEDRGR